MRVVDNFLLIYLLFLIILSNVTFAENENSNKKEHDVTSQTNAIAPQKTGSLETQDSNLGPSHKPEVYLLCKIEKLARTIHLVRQNELYVGYYSRDGNERRVTSSFKYDDVLKIVLRIKTNLEKAGWNCKDISGSPISTPNS